MHIASPFVIYYSIAMFSKNVQLGHISKSRKRLFEAFFHVQKSEKGLDLKDIFSYSDFKEYLRDKIALLKEGDSSFTYRKISSELGIKSAGYITQVLNGASTLSAKLLPEFVRVLGLKKREALYFEVLVNYNQAKDEKVRSLYYQKMTELKKLSQTKLDPESYLFYEKWYYSAIRSIIDLVDFDGTNFRDISNLIVPSISEKQVEKAIKVLKKLKLIKMGDNGFYRLAHKNITTGLNSDSVVLNNFVINTVDIAKESLYNFPVKERSFSALTLCVSKSCFNEIKDNIAEFRKQTLELVSKDSNLDKVCQLNIQLFPLSKSWEGDDEK